MPSRLGAPTTTATSATLWRQIDTGDDGIGLPPYNGGLFAAARSPLLARSVMPDHVFAPLLDAMSRERTAAHPRFINYRDLSVQHLGSVYERLLEFDLRPADRALGSGSGLCSRSPTDLRAQDERQLLHARRSRHARHPADARRRCSRNAAPRSPPALPADRAAADPATAFTRLRIVDPAMGSGHFLVSLVDYLADETMRATDEAAAGLSRLSVPAARPPRGHPRPHHGRGRRQ